MLPLIRAAAVSVALASAADAQEQNLPPLNTPVFEPICMPDGLAVAFHVCTMQMAPSATVSVGGEPVMMFMAPAITCGSGYALTEEGIDGIARVLPGSKEQVNAVAEQAREAMRDPAKYCPQAAMF